MNNKIYYIVRVLYIACVYIYFHVSILKGLTNFRCNIFKAASTSWMYNFNLMANYSAAFLDKTKEVPLVLARRKYARPTTEMIKKAQADSITFLIVRHPLERLASAYNDKIVHAWPKSFHDKLGRMIIKKYRKVMHNNISSYKQNRYIFNEIERKFYWSNMFYSKIK